MTYESLKVFKLINGRYLLSGECISCNDLQGTVVDAQAYFDWTNGQFIQNVFPDMPLDKREFLISGMCGKCFDKLFKEEK